MNLIDTQKLFLFVANQMIDSEPRLTALDQIVGDGDHGFGMQRGFITVRDLLNDKTFQPSDIGALFFQAGTKMMASMGGASGAIFGTFFRAGGKSIAGELELTSKVLSQFLNSGWEAVHQRGKAKPGDKTMVDALAAAAETAKQYEEEPLDIALSNIAKAAMQGADGTKNMEAAFGRAKTLGDKGIGHVDPGAVSMALIVQFMSDGLKSI